MFMMNDIKELKSLSEKILMYFGRDKSNGAKKGHKV